MRHTFAVNDYVVLTSTMGVHAQHDVDGNFC